MNNEQAINTTLTTLLDVTIQNLTKSLAIVTEAKGFYETEGQRSAIGHLLSAQEAINDLPALLQATLVTFRSQAQNN